MRARLLTEGTRNDVKHDEIRKIPGLFKKVIESYNIVKEYFRNRPDDLLVMNICGGEGWEVLCLFLNKPIPSVPFPKLNVWASNFD